MANKELIAECFKPVMLDMQQGKHSEYWLKGGRGSTKSSFLSLAIIIGLLEDPNSNAMIYRRVGNTIKDSVFNQMVWAIDTLGLTDQFKYQKSPIEIIYKHTGQRIMFRGADNPLKSKSIKLTKGYFKYLWFEELAEFRSMEDIRTITQSIFRSVDRAFTLYSYNPPRTASCWVNEAALENNPERLVHTSTYLDVIQNHRDWLGEDFITRAEMLKLTNERAYKNEYLGEVTGNGGQVFENVTVREIPEEEMNTLQWFYQGVDWGYFPDPFQWVRCAYDSRRRKLYIVDEYRVNKAGNRDAYNAVKDRLNSYEQLTADSAEPKSIADWKEFGAWWMRGAVKGAGSVEYSTKWLASLSEIVIDSKCVHTANEFLGYEYEQNQRGEFVNHFPDMNNHSIDAVRYAMYPVWKHKGE